MICLQYYSAQAINILNVPKHTINTFFFGDMLLFTNFKLILQYFNFTILQ